MASYIWSNKKHYPVYTEWPCCLINYHLFLWRAVSCSNLIFISFDGIHSFSSPVETKAKPLPQLNTHPGFYSVVNTSLKYTSWLNSVVFTVIQCVCAVVVPFSLAFRKFKVNKALCNLFLGIFFIPFCLFSISFRVRFDLSITACPVGLCGIP